MKFGLRTPSLKRSKNKLKKQIVHRAGVKIPRGNGWLRNL